MTLCEHCAGTFYPESAAEVSRYVQLQREQFMEPERWHMTWELLNNIVAMAGWETSDAMLVSQISGLDRCRFDPPLREPLSTESPD